MKTAKYNAVPGCPRVDVLSIDYDKAAVRSNEAEPGQALLIVPVAELSSFEELDLRAERNGWLIEWDGGWATRDSEREAWIRVGELCADSQDSGYTAADFKVSRNMPPTVIEADTATDIAALDAIHVYVADSLERNGRIDTAGLTGKVIEELRKTSRQF